MVQRPGLRSAVYGTVHHEDTLKSFKREYDNVLTSGFLLLRYCHYCAESDVKHYSLTHSRQEKRHLILREVMLKNIHGSRESGLV